MNVLVDSSVWIDYFKSGKNSQKLNFLIDENLVIINELILAELVPSLLVRKHKKTADLLCAVSVKNLSIDWDEIIGFQVKCLKKGVNGVGISDLIIIQTAKQNDLAIYSLDKHFKLTQDILQYDLY